MYLQELLEVAIGLVFVYLLLSLVCMQVQEWLASMFRWRADNLEDGLREMLADDAVREGWLRTLRKIPILKQILQAIGRWSIIQRILKSKSVPGWIDTLYAHPLIRSLAQPGTKPSYIPAHNFGLALFDMVMTAGTEASLVQQTLQALRKEVEELLKLRGKDRLQYVAIIDAAIVQAQKLLDLARPGKVHSREYDKMRADAWAELKRQLESLGLNTDGSWIEHPEIVVEGAGTDSLLRRYPYLVEKIFKPMSTVITDLHKMPALESSVPSSSSHSSGEISAEETWYRIRQGVAALLVWKPQLARALDSLLLEASTVTSQHEQALALARNRVEQWFDATMDRTTGWYKRNVHLTLFIIGLILAGFLNIDTFGIATALWREPTIRQALVAQAEKFEPPPAEPGAADPSQAIRQLSTTLTQDLHLPVGWTPENRPTDTSDWLVKGIGLLVTAGAAAQGAPVWFDALGKFMNVRGSGKKPAIKEQPQPEDQVESTK